MIFLDVDVSYNNNILFQVGTPIDTGNIINESVMVSSVSCISSSSKIDNSFVVRS